MKFVAILFLGFSSLLVARPHGEDIPSTQRPVADTNWDHLRCGPRVSHTCGGNTLFFAYTIDIGDGFAPAHRSREKAECSLLIQSKKSDGTETISKVVPNTRSETTESYTLIPGSLLGDPYKAKINYMILPTKNPNEPPFILEAPCNLQEQAGSKENDQIELQLAVLGLTSTSSYVRTIPIQRSCKPTTTNTPPPRQGRTGELLMRLLAMAILTFDFFYGLAIAGDKHTPMSMSELSSSHTTDSTVSPVYLIDVCHEKKIEVKAQSNGQLKLLPHRLYRRYVPEFGRDVFDLTNKNGKFAEPPRRILPLSDFPAEWMCNEENKQKDKLKEYTVVYDGPPAEKWKLFRKVNRKKATGKFMFWNLSKPPEESVHFWSDDPKDPGYVGDLK